MSPADAVRRASLALVAPQDDAQPDKKPGAGKRQNHSDGAGQGGVSGRLNALLRIEAAFREAGSVNELQYCLVNETRELLPFGQAVAFRETGRGRFRPKAVSGETGVAADAPFMRWLRRLLANMVAQAGDAAERPLALPLEQFDPGDEFDSAALPFRHLLWVPLKHKKRGVFAGVIYMRAQPWLPQDAVVAGRMAATAAHAWTALTGEARLRRRLPFSAWAGLAMIVTFAAAFIPVSLRVLAPFEVTPIEPALVTAPVAGAIRDIKVAPNTWVKEGDLLFTYEDTDFANEYRVSQRALAVVNARRRRQEQSAITEAEAKRDLAETLAEERLALAERDHAKSRLERTEVRAPRSGLLLYSDRKDWLGKPVQTGERIMQIADPRKVEVTIDLPVADAVVLEEGLQVQLFLHADPLNSRSAVVRRVAHSAEVTGQDVLAYRLTATLAESASAVAIGNRGVAQIEGETVSLFFFLFRRPISAARQYFGF